MNLLYTTTKSPKYLVVILLTFIVFGITIKFILHQNMTSQIEEVVALIEHSPAWTEISLVDMRQGTTQKPKEILSYMEMVSHYNSQVIRKAIEVYIETKKANDAYNVSCMGKLYVLNRYLFNVPSASRHDFPQFGGWMGITATGIDIDSLWPLSIDDTGKLQLTGQLLGYKGHDYLALEEFDYFSKNFSLRKLHSK